MGMINIGCSDANGPESTRERCINPCFSILKHNGMAWRNV